MSPKPIRVIIVEDHLLTRLGLTMVLNAYPAIEVVGEADNGVSALQLINEIEPDVAIIDIGLPHMDGIECTTIVKSSTCLSRILLRSSHQEDDAILAAIAAGADGYCLKDSSDDVLIEAIKTVASGRAWLDSRIALQIKTILSPANTSLNGHRQRALATAIELSKEELEGLNSIDDAVQESSSTDNNGTTSYSPDNNDTNGANSETQRADYVRLLMKKIASTLAQIN